MKYRKFYQEKTGRKIPMGFHIHHIDHNRDNDSIENLVAIPKSLHEKYHNSCERYDPGVNVFIPNKDLGFFQMQGGGKDLHERFESIYEISLWIVYREVLLGNFHLTKKLYTY